MNQSRAINIMNGDAVSPPTAGPTAPRPAPLPPVPRTASVTHSTVIPRASEAQPSLGCITASRMPGAPCNGAGLGRWGLLVMGPLNVSRELFKTHKPTCIAHVSILNKSASCPAGALPLLSSGNCCGSRFWDRMGGHAALKARPFPAHQAHPAAALGWEQQFHPPWPASALPPSFLVFPTRTGMCCYFSRLRKKAPNSSWPQFPASPVGKLLITRCLRLTSEIPSCCPADLVRPTALSRSSPRCLTQGVIPVF